MWGSVSKLGRQCYIDQNDSLGIEINIWEKNHRIEALAPKQGTLTCGMRASQGHKTWSER